MGTVFRECVDCGVEFFVTEKTQMRIREMVSRGEYTSFQLPKRCYHCRKKMKRVRDVQRTSEKDGEVWDD